MSLTRNVLESGWKSRNQNNGKTDKVWSTPIRKNGVTLLTPMLQIINGPAEKPNAIETT